MKELTIGVCDDEEFYRDEIKALLAAYEDGTGYQFTVREWESVL